MTIEFYCQWDGIEQLTWEPVSVEPSVIQLSSLTRYPDWNVPFDPLSPKVDRIEHIEDILFRNESDRTVLLKFAGCSLLESQWFSFGYLISAYPSIFKSFDLLSVPKLMFTMNLTKIEIPDIKHVTKFAKQNSYINDLLEFWNKNIYEPEPQELIPSTASVVSSSKRAKDNSLGIPFEHDRGIEQLPKNLGRPSTAETKHAPPVSKLFAGSSGTGIISMQSDATSVIPENPAIQSDATNLINLSTDSDDETISEPLASALNVTDGTTEEDDSNARIVRARKDEGHRPAIIEISLPSTSVEPAELCKTTSEASDDPRVTSEATKEIKDDYGVPIFIDLSSAESSCSNSQTTKIDRGSFHRSISTQNSENAKRIESIPENPVQTVASVPVPPPTIPISRHVFQFAAQTPKTIASFTSSTTPRTAQITVVEAFRNALRTCQQLAEQSKQNHPSPSKTGSQITSPHVSQTSLSKIPATVDDRCASPVNHQHYIINPAIPPLEPVVATTHTATTTTQINRPEIEITPSASTENQSVSNANAPPQLLVTKSLSLPNSAAELDFSGWFFRPGAFDEYEEDQEEVDEVIQHDPHSKNYDLISSMTHSKALQDLSNSKTVQLDQGLPNPSFQERKHEVQGKSQELGNSPDSRDAKTNISQPLGSSTSSETLHSPSASVTPSDHSIGLPFKDNSRPLKRPMIRSSTSSETDPKRIRTPPEPKLKMVRFVAEAQNVILLFKVLCGLVVDSMRVGMNVEIGSRVPKEAVPKILTARNIFNSAAYSGTGLSSDLLLPSWRMFEVFKCALRPMRVIAERLEIAGSSAKCRVVYEFDKPQPPTLMKKVLTEVFSEHLKIEDENFGNNFYGDESCNLETLELIFNPWQQDEVEEYAQSRMVQEYLMSKKRQMNC